MTQFYAYSDNDDKRYSVLRKYVIDVRQEISSDNVHLYTSTTSIHSNNSFVRSDIEILRHGNSWYCRAPNDWFSYRLFSYLLSNKSIRVDGESVFVNNYTLLDRCIKQYGSYFTIIDGFIYVNCGEPQICVGFAHNEPSYISLHTPFDTFAYSSGRLSHLFFPINCMSIVVSFLKNNFDKREYAIEDITLHSRSELSAPWGHAASRIAEHLPEWRDPGFKALRKTGDPTIALAAIECARFASGSNLEDDCLIRWLRAFRGQVEAEIPPPISSAAERTVQARTPFVYAANARTGQGRAARRLYIADTVPIRTSRLPTTPTPCVAIRRKSRAEIRTYTVTSDGEFMEQRSGHLVSALIALGWPGAPDASTFLSKPLRAARGNPESIVSAQTLSSTSVIEDDRDGWIACLKWRGERVLATDDGAAWRRCGEPVIEIKPPDGRTRHRVRVVPEEEVTDWGFVLPLRNAAIAQDAIRRCMGSKPMSVDTESFEVLDPSAFKLTHDEVLARFAERHPASRGDSEVAEAARIRDTERLVASLRKFFQSTPSNTTKEAISRALDFWDHGQLAGAGARADDSQDEDAIAAAFETDA